MLNNNRPPVGRYAGRKGTNVKLYVLNGLIGRRGGPRECADVLSGMALRIYMADGSQRECTVERVWKRAVRAGGVNFHVDDKSVSNMVILACNSGLPCYDSATEQPLHSGHTWREETLREPNFQVAYGAKRTCIICGRVEIADYTAGRIGGDWVAQ